MAVLTGSHFLRHEHRELATPTGDTASAPRPGSARPSSCSSCTLSHLNQSDPSPIGMSRE